MFKPVALLLLCSSFFWSRFASNASPSGGLTKQDKPQKLEDIIGLFVCGGTEDRYHTHTTTLDEYDIETFSHKVSYQLWIESGVQCHFRNGVPLGNITWTTTTVGDNACSTSVERSALNGGIQRYFRAHPTITGRQCLIILHGEWKGYVAFSTEKGSHSAIDYDCTGFLSPQCILSGSNDCQGLFC